jgi:phospholipase C
MFRSDSAARAAEQRAAWSAVAKRGAPSRPPPDPALPVGEDTLPQIQHIVILMMENHSYDSYLGTLGVGDGLPKGADGSPNATNPRKNGALVASWPKGDTSQVKGLPGQSWHGSHVQWNSGRNDGFVWDCENLLTEMGPTPPDPKISMTYWQESELPFYHALATTFPLMDRWFASCLGPTFPNRRFLIAGTAHGLIDDVPTGMFDQPTGGTIFDLLTAHGIDWVNYHHVTPVRLNSVRFLGGAGVAATRAVGLLLGQVPGLKSYLGGKGGWHEFLMGRVQFTANLYPLRRLSMRYHLRSLERFFQDAAVGTLPPVSIVDPDFGEFSEESDQDIAKGQRFSAEVIRAVMRGKGWAHTLLVWTYDEHGGYFDHVPPPAAEPPDKFLGHELLQDWFGNLDWFLRRFKLWRKLTEANDGKLQNRLLLKKYERLGFRVPTVVVSPFAKANYVSSRDGPHDGPPETDGERAYDHTSMLKFIERKWNLPPLTARDAAAKDFLDVLDLSDPPFLQPPQQLFDIPV